MAGNQAGKQATHGVEIYKRMPVSLAVKVEIHAAPLPLTRCIGATRVLPGEDASALVGARAGVGAKQARGRLGISGTRLLEEDAAASTERVALATAAELGNAEDRTACAVPIAVDVCAVRPTTDLEGGSGVVGLL
ncbi:MAG: hypothetical protein M1835_003452 [Candelina submexicana]|nr:MAG: hypothetical protein M1835_003452 [Candelina submexicana]